MTLGTFLKTNQMRDRHVSIWDRTQNIFYTVIDAPRLHALQKVEHLCCPKGNWRHFWDHENNPNCFHLEHICRGSNGEWFYDHDVSTTDHTKHHQPTLRYNSKPRYHFNISNSTIYNGDISQCPYSHTPHHVVSQAEHSHMMLEFYVRLVMGLNLWMKEFPPESDHDLRNEPTIRKPTFQVLKPVMWALLQTVEIFLQL